MSRRITRGLCVGGLVFLLGAGLQGLATATGSHGLPGDLARTYAPKCTRAAYRPSFIMFACADGGYYVQHLRWKRWTTTRAVAHGVFHFNDCTPDCARGTFHKRHGKLAFSHRLWCPAIQKHVFRRTRITYRRPYQGRRVIRTRNFCPF
jgi:hypothetical protein